MTEATDQVDAEEAEKEDRDEGIVREIDQVEVGATIEKDGLPTWDDIVASHREDMWVDLPGVKGADNYHVVTMHNVMLNHPAA